MRTIRNCSVAVIGGAGFLGSHLTNHLVDDRGCEVTVIDNLVAGRREFVHKDAKFIHHDITGSEEFLCRTFKENGVRFVFNYAAYPYIPVSFARPLHVFNVNASGALKVINAAQDAGCEGILQVSSAEIYGDGPKRLLRDEPMADVGDVPYYKEMKIDETGIVIPHSSYGAAKAAIDAMVQVRWREAKTPCIALRQFNCVGERETHPYIVPEIIGQLAKAQDDYWGREVGAWSSDAEPKLRVEMAKRVPIIRLGNNSFRDFLYAGDAVRIAVELLERGQFGEVYNLGSETGIKMYELAKLIGKVMGFADVQVERDESRVRPWEIWALLSANDKIYEAIGWHSRKSLLVKLESAIRKTVDWYESNGRKWAWER